MINKKFSAIISMVAIVAVASTLYTLDEMNPGITISGSAQFADRTFEEQVEVAGIIVEGKITDVGMKIFTEEFTDIDENGNEYVFDTRQVPKTKVTVKISEIFKDNYGLDSNKVTFYDISNGEIGNVNGKKAKFISQYAIDYKVGDKGIFLIENDRGLWSMGYTSFYPIEDGKTHTTSELDKLSNKSPIEITKAKESAKHSTVYPESNIFFVTDPLNTFKIDYKHDRVENGDLKYLLEAQKKLDKSNALPIVSTYADGTMEAIQLGLNPEIFDTMTEIEIADIIRDIVDVTVYVFFESPRYPELG